MHEIVNTDCVICDGKNCCEEKTEEVFSERHQITYKSSYMRCASCETEFLYGEQMRRNLSNMRAAKDTK